MRGNASPPRRVWLSRVFVATLGLLLLVAIVSFAISYFGLVAGQEFSPYTFKRRSFVYRQVPLLGWQVTPIYYSDQTNDLETYLVTKKLLGADSDQQRWDLVAAVEGTKSIQGESRVLCLYLDAQDQNQALAWLQWSQKHDDLARVLWPAVAEVARLHLYTFAPSLLRLASTAASADQLQRDLDQKLAAQYLAAANAFQTLERHQQAIELYSAALARVPNLGPAVEGRDRSEAALQQWPRAQTAQTRPATPQ